MSALAPAAWIGPTPAVSPVKPFHDSSLAAGIISSQEPGTEVPPCFQNTNDPISFMLIVTWVLFGVPAAKFWLIDTVIPLSKSEDARKVIESSILQPLPSLLLSPPTNVSFAPPPTA